MALAMIWWAKPGSCPFESGLAGRRSHRCAGRRGHGRFRRRPVAGDTHDPRHCVHNSSMSAPSAAPPALERERPPSLNALFWSFTWLALQGFGGVLTVVQRELVDRKKWLTREEFIEDWAVAQILPGPNVVNLSLMLGDRYFGFPGAMVAMTGMLAFPLLCVLLLAALFAGVANVPAAQGALRGMGAVAAGLIVATGLKLMPALKKNVMGLGVCCALAVATFIAIALLHIALIWVLPGLGGIASVWAWHQLGEMRTEAAKGQP